MVYEDIDLHYQPFNSTARTYDAPLDFMSSQSTLCEANRVDMKQLWALILIVMGLSLLFCGFVYDALFAGIPYQDPTPQLSERYAYHAHIASIMSWIGFGIFLFGIIAGLIHVIVRRFRTRVDL